MSDTDKELMGLLETFNRKKVADVKKLNQVMDAILGAEYDAQNAIKQYGNEIVVPEHLTIEDAIRVMEKHLKEREETATKEITITCHPDDGMYALYRSLEMRFSRVMGAENWMFWWKIPPKEHSIQIDYNKTMTVPIGNLALPGMDGKIDMWVGTKEDPKDPMNGLLMVRFEYRRKYTPLVEDIERELRRLLAEDSIFRAKAINSDFEFINLGGDTSKLVYTRHEQETLDANLYSPIVSPDVFAEIGEDIRRTVLLHGKFGTGKTLTALKCAQLAVDNGWTFIEVKGAQHIVRALAFANRFQPSVLFCEDVDVATGGTRSDQLNAILNSIDGLLSKESKVITILTTNQLDHINRAMLRPGRIDLVLRIGQVDAESIVRLVQAYGGDTIEGELDGDALYAAADGYVPAFVAEGVKSAKRYAIARYLASGKDGEIKITSEDIESSLIGLRAQWDLMNSDAVDNTVTLDSLLREMFEDNAPDSEAIAEEVAEEIARHL